ncbi:MAG: hypothetical protein J1F39_06660 [Clostridiales bacterium]|nr:hypothetical protein [Clostridiales bacterium]
MYRLALLGRDIGYTKSPAVHKAIAAALAVEVDFEVCDVTLDKLDGAVNSLIKNKDAFFITKPYKNDVKRFLSKINTKCGVNFVICRDKAGYNTDGIGFISSLDGTYPSWRDEVDGALVLGAGGAAYAVTEALINAGKKVYVLNRTVVNAAKLCSALGAEIYLNQPAELIVNCTSLGLHGEDALYSMCVMPSFKYGFDLVYSGGETPFLRRLREAGCKTQNGMDMLVYQAIAGDKILLGNETLDAEKIFKEVGKILNKG